jgi:hypothetical protein
MNEKILTSHGLRPTKPREFEPKRSESLTTSDVDSAKLKRNRIISLATEEELDEFAEMIRPRIEREEEIVVVKCSNPKCIFRGRNRRKKLGEFCSVCARRAYEVEGETFVAGVLVEVVGKELADFYEEEKRANKRLLKEARERQEALSILGKAGFYPRRDY